MHLFTVTPGCKEGWELKSSENQKDRKMVLQAVIFYLPQQCFYMKRIKKTRCFHLGGHQYKQEYELQALGIEKSLECHQISALVSYCPQDVFVWRNPKRLLLAVAGPSKAENQYRPDNRVS